LREKGKQNVVQQIGSHMDTREQQLRTWSMLCHLSALTGVIVPHAIIYGSLLGPFLVWQIKKNELPEIDAHAKESLNFQITILVITLIFSFFLYSTFGYATLIDSPFATVSGSGLGLLLFMLRVVSWILVIVATIRANNGELFHYPSIRFIN